MRTSSPPAVLVTALLGLLLALPAVTGRADAETPSPGADADATALARPGPSSGRWPLRPEPDVVRGFEPPSSEWGAGHRGVDLGGQVGQRVYAAAAGRVSFAGTLAGRGVVVVDHGGTRTTYEPVAAAVAVGDRVAAGQTIGHLQLFGSHCFPRSCLHWGLLDGARYLNPLTLVGAGPVRLLPLLGGPGGSNAGAATPAAPAPRALQPPDAAWAVGTWSGAPWSARSAAGPDRSPLRSTSRAFGRGSLFRSSG